MGVEETACGNCGKASRVFIQTPQGPFCPYCYEEKYPGPAPSLTPQRPTSLLRPSLPSPRPRPSPLPVALCTSIGFEGIPGAGVRTQRDLLAIALTRAGKIFRLHDGPPPPPTQQGPILLTAHPFSNATGPGAELPQVVILLEVSPTDAQNRLITEGQERENSSEAASTKDLCAGLEEAIAAAEGNIVLLIENGSLPAYELHERIWARCSRALVGGEEDV